MAQYERFQYSTKETINLYQIENLKKLLRHAYTKSDYYRELYDEHGVNLSSIHTLEDIKKLPYLTKNDLVKRYGQIATSSVSPLTSKKTTGGSTGQVVTLLKNSAALARERAATWRSYKWAGVEMGDQQARFWGAPIHNRRRIKYKIIDFIANRNRFSAFDISEQRLETFYRQLVKLKPSYLYGYVSIIEIFSQYINDHNYILPSSVKCAITTSEVLTKKSRRVIEDSLNIKVFNEYGCGEVGSIAHECECGEMHLMEDNLIVEIVAGDKESGAGEIVVTDLFNYATPLIRYKLGDYASIPRVNCSCGRSLRTIGNIHGRAYDCIYTKRGNIYHPEIIMYIFEDIKDNVGGIDQFQVIQESIESLCIRIVKADDYSLDMEKYIDKEIKARLDTNISTRYEYVDEIQREASGKLRLVKSNIHG